MNEYLVSIANIEDAERDSYILYNITGGIYYCKHKHWHDFTKFFTRTQHQQHHLTMDLCLAVSHSLIFDIDIEYKTTDKAILQKTLSDYLDKILGVCLKPLFIPKIGNFTCIMGFRENGGIHLHFPEMEVAHDDYIILCNQLKPEFRFENEYVSCTLDILQNAFLISCGKPNKTVYTPSRIFFIDENTNEFFNMNRRDGDQHTFEYYKANFKRTKKNQDSFFRRLLMISTFQDMLQLASDYMMPVVAVCKPVHKLLYHTWINNEPESIGQIVAQFQYRLNDTQFIHKAYPVSIEGSSWMKSFNYISCSAIVISNLQTSNNAIKRWYESYKSRVQIQDGIFHDLNVLLRLDNISFADDPNPLKTILLFKKGYYFLPVFYALKKYLNLPSRNLIQHLRTILENDALLDRLEEMDEDLFHQIANDFTLNTILYCGSNMTRKPTNMKEKINLVIQNMRNGNGSNLLSCVSSPEQMIGHIKRIQERHFPIVMISMLNSCKKSQRYMWNFINECWQEIISQNDVYNLINTIWSFILIFLKTNNCTAETKTLNTNLIVSTIMTETNVEQKELEMDKHKWHLRVNDGIFDLMTGHLSGTVPEFYISYRKMGVDFKDMSQLRTRQDLVHTYRILVDKSFFLKYLKALFEDLTDDLYETCKEIFCQMGGSLNPLTESMLQFYVHFCKYTSFEYDVMMYMADIVSSILIATNYSRKFMVFKGNTRNGKSKFFQMISKVFGGYSHTIRSINLQSGNFGLQAQPELASSIFCCRIVTVEELSGKLNENMIKELTGNSNVSFRKLYESNTGGIPTAKIFASTNSLPSCTATEAFKDRIVAVPFEAVFTQDYPPLTSEQVEKGMYQLDTSDSLIEDSCLGFFVFIYQHFLHVVNTEKGTIVYRKEPDALVEYKEHFLVMTDIFNQFQQHMDVQIVPGCVTSVQDVKSAIRQFLKQTHNSSWDENDLLIRFHGEYKHLRHQETDFYQEDYNDDDDDELSFEPVAKISRNNEECAVIYRNVQIKNLRKERR